MVQVHHRKQSFICTKICHGASQTNKSLRFTNLSCAVQIHCKRVLCDRMLLLHAQDKEANQPNELMLARRLKGK